jgi:hypothetical protein
MELSKIIRRTIEWLVIAIVALALMIIFYSGTAAQTVRRVSLPGDRVVYSDTAGIGERDTYVIRLKKGQSCQVEVEWQGADVADEGQGLSGLTIVYPNGKRLTDAQDGFIEAAATGDYKLVVSPKTKKTNYRYRIIFTRN